MPKLTYLNYEIYSTLAASFNHILQCIEFSAYTIYQCIIIDLVFSKVCLLFIHVDTVSVMSITKIRIFKYTWMYVSFWEINMFTFSFIRRQLIYLSIGQKIFETDIFCFIIRRVDICDVLRNNLPFSRRVIKTLF